MRPVTWIQTMWCLVVFKYTHLLHVLLFLNDQELITEDQDDLSYMLRKLQEEYNKWGLTINMQKTKYMVVETDEAHDLDIGNALVKGCNTFKYLEVNLASNGKSNVDIENKIAK